MAPKIRELAKKYLHHPIQISLDTESQPPREILQKALKLTQESKNETLLEELNKRAGSVIVFTRTKSRADRVTRASVDGGDSGRCPRHTGSARGRVPRAVAGHRDPRRRGALDRRPPRARRPADRAAALSRRVGAAARRPGARGDQRPAGRADRVAGTPSPLHPGTPRPRAVGP